MVQCSSLLYMCLCRIVISYQKYNISSFGDISMPALTALTGFSSYSSQSIDKVDGMEVSSDESEN